MTIYIAMVNPCIHESGYNTISIHKTYEGARKAILLNKRELHNEFFRIFEEYISKEYGVSTTLKEYLEDKDWIVEKLELEN